MAHGSWADGRMGRSWGIGPIAHDDGIFGSMVPLADKFYQMGSNTKVVGRQFAAAYSRPRSVPRNSIFVIITDYL